MNCTGPHYDVVNWVPDLKNKQTKKPSIVINSGVKINDQVTYFKTEGIVLASDGKFCSFGSAPKEEPALSTPIQLLI